MIDLLIMIAIVLFLHFVIAKYPEPLPRSENPKREVWEALGLWGLLVLVTTVTVFIVPVKEFTEPTVRVAFLANVALSPFWVILPVVFVLRVNKWTGKDLGFAKPRSWIVLVFALLLFGFAGSRSLFSDPARTPLGVPFILMALYQPAFTEELFFRGIIQGKLERALGQNKAWIF